MPNEVKEQTSGEARALRLLIQQVQTSAGKSWRLIVYGDGERYRAPEFASFEALLAVLRRVLPDLDLSGIAALPAEPGSSILYATDVRLTEAQRTSLGLISASPRKAGEPCP